MTEPDSMTQRDRELIAIHLRKMATANDAGEVATSVHWLDKILKRHGSSLESLALTPEWLTGEGPRKLGAYVDANRQYAARESALISENARLRRFFSVYERVKAAGERFLENTNDILGSVRRWHNNDNLIFNGAKWIGYGLMGPLVYGAHHFINKDSSLIRSRDSAEHFLGYIFTSAICAATYGTVNIADSIRSESVHKSAVAEAYNQAAKKCPKGQKSDPDSWCTADYPAVQGPLTGIFPFWWVANTYYPGTIILRQRQMMKPVVNDDGIQVGNHDCREWASYKVGRTGLDPSIAGKLSLAARYTEPSKWSCTFVPLPTDQSTAPTHENAKTLRKIVTEEGAFQPTVDENGTYVGKDYCQRRSSYIVSGLPFAQNPEMQPGWRTPTLIDQTEWSCEMKSFEPL